MKLFQIVQGEHAHTLTPDGLKILTGHTGAVTLWQSPVGLVLFDTGSRAAWPKVKSGLANRGVMPEQVDFVFLTHFHLDHGFNVAHFTNAQVLGWCHHWTPEATEELGSDLNSTTLSGVVPGLSSLRTPGHDECMNSFFLEGITEIQLTSGEVRPVSGLVCISGDAINHAVIESGGEKLPYNYDQKLYKKSAQKILAEDPSLIIPGHGPLIEQPMAGWGKINLA